MAYGFSDHKITRAVEQQRTARVRQAPGATSVFAVTSDRFLLPLFGMREKKTTRTERQHMTDTLPAALHGSATTDATATSIAAVAPATGAASYTAAATATAVATATTARCGQLRSVVVAQHVRREVRKQSCRQRLERHVHKGGAQGNEVELSREKPEPARSADEKERHLYGIGEAHARQLSSLTACQKKKKKKHLKNDRKEKREGAWSVRFFFVPCQCAPWCFPRRWPPARETRKSA